MRTPSKSLDSRLRLVLIAPWSAEYCFRFANGLASTCEVLVFLNRSAIDSPWVALESIRHSSLSLRLVDFKLSRGAFPSILPILWTIVRFRPDMVLFQECPDVITPLYMFILKFLAPNLLTVHDPVTHTGDDSALPRWMEALRRFGRWLADNVAVHGKFCKNQFLQAEPHWTKGIIEISHGVVMVPETLADPEPSTLLMFGRMQAYKGLDIFAESLELLKSRGLCFRAIVAGRGPSLDALEKRIASIGNVEVINRYIRREEAERLYQRASVIVMPYRDATQSGVVAAAFGAHRTVIASSVGGIPDVVVDGKNGLLVEPGSPVALADAIQRVLKDRALLDHLTLGATRSGSDELNWDKIGAELATKLRPLSRR